MKKTLFLLLLVFLAFSVFAQSKYVISGRVIDAITKRPLQSASIFAQNTTIGATTDAEGNFKLTFPEGGYELAITYTGYQTQIIRISSTTATDKIIIIELNKSEQELATVIVSSSEVENGWKQYGQFFIDNFIGNTDNSKFCVLKNKEALRFYFIKRRNCLKILARQPLEFTNEALGYKITYALDSFVYDYNEKRTLYIGHPFFEEIVPVDNAQKAKWKANRINAYNGSMLQFMRSLYNKKLKEDGFEIKFLMHFDTSYKAVPLLNYYESIHYLKNDSSGTVAISPKENDIMVIYKKAKPENSYLHATGQIPDSVKFQVSLLSFPFKQPITIEANGYYYKQATIIKSDYLSWRRMADTLPYDFKLD